MGNDVGVEAWLATTMEIEYGLVEVDHILVTLIGFL